MKNKILSLDGGGVKGIVQAVVLQYLEEKIIEEAGNKNARISDFIDFVGGTSTGSIIGAMLSIPDESGRPQYKMEDIVNAYFILGEKVFKKSLLYNIKTLWGFISPKYPKKYIENQLIKKLDHHKLGDLLVPCAFTAYDTKIRKPIIFTNKDPKQKYSNVFVKDVVRGSTSIPAFFEPAYFMDGKSVYTLIDGGVFANNPSIVSYLEAGKTKEITDVNGEVTPENTIMMSLGTIDSTLKTYKFSKIHRWGMSKWFIPILNILLQGVNEVTNYEMKKIYQHNRSKDNFYRIAPEIILGDNSATNGSMKNMKNLRQDAINYINVNSRMLDKLAKDLIHNSSYGPMRNPDFSH